MVPISNPPTAPVPIDLFPSDPTPLANTNGIKPRIKANEVIKIGRKRDFAPSIAASTMLSPFRLSAMLFPQ